MKVYMTGISKVKSPEKTSRTNGQTYTKEALIDFIAGNTLLATGGGGAEQIARNLLETSGITSVETVTIDQIDDDIATAMVAQVFAPSALWENQDYHSALRSFEKNVGRGLVFPGETGAVNGIVPVIVSALTDSMLLDGSTSDRSLPEMDMTLFQNTVRLGTVDIVGPAGTPVCSKDFGNDTNALDAENFILSTMSSYQEDFQGVGGFAAYPLTGRQLKETAASGLLYAGTFDYALQLGMVMREQGTLDAIMATVQDYLGSGHSPYTLFTGYLVDDGLHPHAQDYGCIDLRCDDPDSALGLRIYSSNENMIALATFWVLFKGVMTAIELFPVAIGPDGITYLLLEGESTKGYKAGFSFTNEAFDPQYGDPDFFREHKFAVIGIPEPRLRRPDIIDSFKREISRAMESFGKTYIFSYTPIEDLPKLRPHFDIRRKKGRVPENLRIHIEQSYQDKNLWFRDDLTFKKVCHSPRIVLDYSEISGRRFSFIHKQQESDSKILSLSWPEIS
jgi:DUF917 family protein